MRRQSTASVNDDEDVPAFQPIKNGFEITICQIDVENSCIDILIIYDVYGLPYGAHRADNRSVGIFHSGGNVEGDKNFVLHDQYAPQERRFDSVDADREKGVIRSKEYAFSQDGGLAVLYGNLAEDGCIVKTAGVDDSILKFSGPARIFESQDTAVLGILNGKIKAGDIVLIRYEGPRGGPGMQEMLYPTSYLKSKGLGKACALITDGRFSGGSSGLSIGHVSPEAAEGGTIGLVREGDIIDIDIPNRKIHLAVDDATLAERRAEQEATGWKPLEERKRKVSTALKAYASMATSAAKGAVRKLPD